VKFGHQVLNSLKHIFTVGICKILSMEGEILIARRQWNGGFNPLLLSLTLGNPIRKIRGKA